MRHIRYAEKPKIAEKQSGKGNVDLIMYVVAWCGFTLIGVAFVLMWHV
ncbi:hypothetical protein ABENE_04500 [Asticcacaulis benevestitus DSM 16100 = ATCC BAA-896]|uniref:Uncharacterized protein n=1 Tax=Asticcacaulis benevestitus DSM 16100 = ATCC BAA-896 TaxID=1121022 RepID=V4RRY0_9CAUL|nr:hypothetical protein ABENE_04500 [Asticcacaulis benevestitus DSM 16100 = ATCC BAA-896]